ncbi:MAG: amidase, partial [Acidobacteria bacterium]|nr:amidase [Acidobacteriota bacterium]
MSELTAFSATKIAGMIRARAVSPVEIVEAYLARIEELNPSLNAVVTIAPDCLERAREMEDALMKGEPVGALHGVPVTIKDTFDVAGLRSTSGSRLRAGRVPESDAVAVERLRAAGAIILGKTNVPEMALTYDSNNPVFGRTNNPHDLSRTAGGSSGGEAASVAAGLSAVGLGSDLVGSIRIPAHFCGIFGLKPTSMTVEGEGHCPQMIGSLRRAAAFGPLARTVEDLRTMLDAIAVKGSGDDDSVRLKTTDKLQKGTRVALWMDDSSTPVTDETRHAVEAVARSLSDTGLEMIEEQPPGLEGGSALWLKRFSPDVLKSIRQVYQTPQDVEQAGPAVRAFLSRAEASTQVSEAERLRVEEECDIRRRALIEWMENVPLIIAPVGAVPAFEHGARKASVGQREMSVFNAFSYSQVFNTFDLPVVCVPAGRSHDGLPIGVQIAARPFCERVLLDAALIVEQSLGGYREPRISAST